MQEVRGHLNDDMGALVDHAREMIDWHRYVRSYPWVAVGAAVLAGFLLVPRRRKAINPDSGVFAEWAREKGMAVQPVASRGGGAVSALKTIVTSAASRGVTAWPSRQVERLADEWAAGYRHAPEPRRR